MTAIGMLEPELLQNAGRIVRGTVVNDNDFDPLEDRAVLETFQP
jgi:hypothetical protein